MRQLLSPEHVNEVLSIARTAGEAIMHVYRSQSGHQGGGSVANVVYKADESPVTEADLRAHAIIARALTRLTPEIPVVSEEDHDEAEYRGSNNVFWLVDPLDGTREFITGNGEFTVNIALIAAGAAIFGVVHAPAPDLLYWGGEGLGAFRVASGKAEPIAVATDEERAHRPQRIVASKSHMNAETGRFIMAVGEHQLVRAGSSLKFCRVAEGSADLYPRLGPTCEWDTAAGQAILEAAGGYVCELDGTPLRYGKKNILNPHFVAGAGTRPLLP